jgi:hypothetical protein
VARVVKPEQGVDRPARARLALDEDHYGDRTRAWPRRTFTPELAAVVLCQSLDSVEFFVGFGRHPLVDVWQVDAGGRAIEPAPDGWVMCRSPIAATRLMLEEMSAPAGTRRAYRRRRAGLIQPAAAADRTTFVVRGHDRERALSERTRALLGRMGVEIEEQ